MSAHKDSGFILELNLPWGSTLPGRITTAAISRQHCSVVQAKRGAHTRTVLCRWLSMHHLC